MHIHTRRRGDIVIIEPRGNITIGEGDVQFREAIHQVLEEGTKKLIIDMSGVKYVDSAGLGELIRAHTSVARRGGVLKLLNLQKKAREILTITKLMTVFESYEREDDAVASFALDE